VLLLVGMQVPEEYIWRITLGFGGIPGLFTLYHRLKLEDSVQFQRSQSLRPSTKATVRLIFKVRMQIYFLNFFKINKSCILFAVYINTHYCLFR